MTEQMEVHKGIAISEEEGKTLDRTKMGVAIAQAPSAEVEAQYPYWTMAMCPHCGNVGWVQADTDFWKYYTCGWCHRLFRV